MKIQRNMNAFEKMLIIVAAAIGIIGFFLLNSTFNRSGQVFDIDMLSAVFLWLLLIFMMIVAAIVENQREELGIIVSEHIKEAKILQQINKSSLEEIRLLREEIRLLNSGAKKRK